MSGASTKQLATRLSSLASQWPSDPFRPNLQLKNFFQSLSQHPNLTPKAVDAVSALSQDAAMKKYALSAKTLKPASSPYHYDRVLEGFAKAALGIKRPWWKRFFGVW